MRHAEIMKADGKAEDFFAAIGELLGDAVRVARGAWLAGAGGENQPVLGDTDEAQIDVNTLRRTGDQPLIGSRILSGIDHANGIALVNEIIEAFGQ